MPTTARKKHLIGTGGPWGTGLLLMGVVSIVIGAAFITRAPANLSPALAWIGQAIPISAWSALWVVSGAYNVVRSLMPPQRHMDLAFSVFVISLWASFYGTYWIWMAVHGVFTREWLFAVIWGCMAGMLVSFGRCVNPVARQKPPRR